MAIPARGAWVLGLFAWGPALPAWGSAYLGVVGGSSSENPLKPLGPLTLDDYRKALRPTRGLEVWLPEARAACCVAEPLPGREQPAPPDPSLVGWGHASLIVSSPWITMRLLGDRPYLGEGETETAIKRAAQLLGDPLDVVPVFTSAQTVTDMMNDYFVPLLRRVPGASDIMSRIHVDGVYLSPTHNLRVRDSSDFDNAFVVGSQSLVVYPSSCFHRSATEICEPPFLTAGHDTSVVAHELGHVVFNTIRGPRSLAGFQWFAVNEGYADYFSASYLNQPNVGYAWQNTRTRAPYLRRLLDFPDLLDPKLMASGHSFSVAWSSLLWSLRQELGKLEGVSPETFDAVVLQSIVHLGEGGGPYLADAARALLKAIYQAGHLDWDPTVRAIMRRRGVDLSSQERLALVAPKETSVPSGGFGCQGSRRSEAAAAGSARSEGHAPIDLGCWVLLLGLALPHRHGPRPSRRALKWMQKSKFKSKLKWGKAAAALAACLAALGGCIKKQAPKKVSDQLRGLGTLSWGPSYACNRALLAGAALESDLQPARIVQLDVSFEKSPDTAVVIFDASTDDPESAVQLRIVPQTRRVDRVLRLDGQPQSPTLDPGSLLSRPEALRLAHATLGTLLFETVPMAKPSRQAGSPEEPLPSPSSPAASPRPVTFRFEGIGQLQAFFGEDPAPDQGSLALRDSRPGALFQTLPDTIRRGQELVCRKEP